MPITGNKEVERDRDVPPPPGFAVRVIWFEPSRASGPRHSVRTVAELRGVLASYHEHERLVVELERDGGAAGAVWVHFTGDRAWVTYWAFVGGPDSYCRDAVRNGPGEAVGFLLTNGQLDDIHRDWTVPRTDGLRALDYFLGHGTRDPGLIWVAELRSLAEPAD